MEHTERKKGITSMDNTSSRLKAQVSYRRGKKRSGRRLTFRCKRVPYSKEDFGYVFLIRGVKFKTITPRIDNIQIEVHEDPWVQINETMN